MPQERTRDRDDHHPAPGSDAAPGTTPGSGAGAVPNVNALIATARQVIQDGLAPHDAETFEEDVRQENGQ